MNPAVGTFFHWLLRASWQAGILVLLILAVQWLFGKKLGARWRHALWFVVLVRLALPFSPASAFSLFNFAPLKPEVPAPASAVLPVAVAPVAVAPAVVRPEPTPLVNAPSSPSQIETHFAVQTQSAPAAARVIPAKTSPNWFHHVNLPLLCAWLWAAGVLLLLVRIIGQNVVFLRGLRSARMIGDGETLALFGRCQAVLGVRAQIRLAETAQVKSPALCGLARPWLLLPAGLTQRFGPAELRHIFLHELAHVKRRDMAVHWAATALQVLHWFNPVLWLGFRRMAADREVACDELALGCAGDRESRPYGETIIKLLELCARPAAAPGLLGILEDKNQMARRIAMIAGFKRHSRWSLPAIALLLVLGLAGLTDARPRATAAKPPAAATTGTTNPLAIKAYDSSGLTVTVYNSNGGTNVPLADMQKIARELQFSYYDGTNRDSPTIGKDPLRGVTRNLLPTTPEPPEPHRVIGNVQNLRFSYYDGTNWNPPDPRPASGEAPHLVMSYYDGTNWNDFPPEAVIPGEAYEVANTFRDNGLDSKVHDDILPGSVQTSSAHNKAVFKDLKMETYDRSGQVLWKLETPDTVLDLATGGISSSSSIKMSTGDNHFSVSGEGFCLDKTNSLLVISNHVRAIFVSPAAANSPASAPAEVTADRCEFVTRDGVAPPSISFSGNVRMTIASHTVEAEHMKMALDGSTDAEKPANGATNDLIHRDPWGNPYTITLDTNAGLSAHLASNAVQKLSTASTVQLTPGQTASFTANAAATALLSYQWYFDANIQGTVLQPDGKPAAKAQVALGKSGKPLDLRNGRLEGSPDETIATTDAAGHFTLQSDSNTAALVIVSDQGFAKIAADKLTPTGTYRLEAYGTVQGTLRTGNRLVTNQLMGLLNFVRWDSNSFAFSVSDFTATTDNQGRFVIKHVPPGVNRIGRAIELNSKDFATNNADHETDRYYFTGTTIDYATQVQVLVKPGEVTQVVIGGGRSLTGKLALNRPETRVDWTQAYVLLYARPPADLDDGRFPGSWINAELSNRHVSGAAVSADGSFHLDDVPAGDYVLNATASENTGQSRQLNGPPPFNTIGSVVQNIVVPPMTGGSNEPLDLGTIELIAYHKPAVGEPATPFETTTVDGQPLKLADYRGKYVLLDLEQYLPGKQRPFMEAVSKAWAGDDRLVIITLFPDVAVNAAKAPVPAGGHWLQGDLGNSAKTPWLKDYYAYWYLAIWGGFGGGGSGGGGTITSLPEIFLIGPDGKFLAVNLSGDGIAKAVTKALGKPK